MSNTQIWIFGILAFIVLLTAASRLGHGEKHPPWALARKDDQRFRELAEQVTAVQIETVQRLDQLGADTTELKERMIAVERMLKEVE